MTYEISGVDVLILSITVWFVGTWLTSKIRFLKTYSIPPPVTGGLLCSLIIAGIYAFGGIEVSIDMRIRDICLLVFFSTIGLSAKMSLLKEGGKALFILLAAASIFLVIQDVTGILVVSAIGKNPAYGLFGGSVSFAGGHGTAIAWGQVAEEAGLAHAAEVGIACATFGLIAGGMLGGPISERLIKRHNLRAEISKEERVNVQDEEVRPLAPAIPTILWGLLVLGVCLAAGDMVNRFLFSNGVTLPGFLTAMIVGIAITNAADLGKVSIPTVDINRLGEICLQLFLCMSLMSMQLWTLLSAIGPILLVLFVQMLVITLFSVFIIFRIMGRNYDAAVIVGGFTGLGLGATPVGIANMKAVTEKYGHSPKAFLVIPLVGAFFIDLVNAIVIKAFVASPYLQQHF